MSSVLELNPVLRSQPAGDWSHKRDWSHKPGGRLPQLDARPVVASPATKHSHPLAGTKLHCLVTEAHVCKQLAGVAHGSTVAGILTCDLLIASLASIHRITGVFYPRNKRGCGINFSFQSMQQLHSTININFKLPLILQSFLRLTYKNLKSTFKTDKSNQSLQMIKKATRSTTTDRFRKHAIKPVSSLLALLWPCEAVNCLHFGAWSKQLFNQHFTNESGCPRHKDNFISIVFRNGCHTCAKKSKYSHQPLNKKIICIQQLIHTAFPSVLWQCWLVDRKGIRLVKNWVLLCWWWHFDCSFAHLIAPVITTPSSPLAPIKFKTQTFWCRLTQVHLNNGR